MKPVNTKTTQTKFTCNLIFSASNMFQWNCNECEEKDKTIADQRRMIEGIADYLHTLESMWSETSEWYKLLQDQNIITSALPREQLPDCFETSCYDPESVLKQLMPSVTDSLLLHAELVSQLQREAEQLQNKNEQLQNKNEQLQNKNKQLQNKNEQLQNKNELLQNKNEQLQNKNEQLQREAAQLKQELSGQQNMYDKMEEKLNGELLQSKKDLESADTRTRETSLQLDNWILKAGSLSL